MAFDAAVIGGGLLGMATAYHLVSAGARTLLVDRADVGRATDAGAGILAPETNSRDPDSWFRLAAEAVDDYPSLIERLRAEQAGDTGYAQCGKLVVAVSDEEIEPFAHARRIIFERQRRRGLPKPGDLHEIGDAEARELFPALAPVHGAIYSRVAARVDGRLLNRAIRTAAQGQGRGLVIREGSVQRLVREGDRVTGLVVGGTSSTRAPSPSPAAPGRTSSAGSSASPSPSRRSADRSSTWVCAAPTRAAGPW